MLSWRSVLWYRFDSDSILYTITIQKKERARDVWQTVSVRRPWINLSSKVFPLSSFLPTKYTQKLYLAVVLRVARLGSNPPQVKSKRLLSYAQENKHVPQFNSSFALHYEAGDKKQATKARIQEQKSEQYTKLLTKGNTGCSDRQTKRRKHDHGTDMKHRRTDKERE